MNKFLSILLLGSIVMLTAEVTAGSSPLWFINPWSIIVVFPLYTAHILFLYNIAQRTNRTSLPHLYILGTILGLYESFITKVVWSGFPGDSQQAIAGKVGGVAIVEFSLLVFFYHPIFSFIVPLKIYNSLTDVDNPHVSWRWFTLSLIYLSTMGASNYGFNPVILALSIIGSLFLIMVFRMLIKDPFDLKLERRGWIGTTIVLALLYGVLTPLLEPTLLPTSITAYLIVLAMYAISFVVFFMSPEAGSEGEKWSRRRLLGYSATYLGTSVVATFIPGIAFPIFLIITLLAATGGPLIYIGTSYKIFKL